MKAIPTNYNSFNFRSRLEARWAVFFDQIGVTYIYEPETLICADGTQYSPDFYLPNAMLRNEEAKGVYLEVKPIEGVRDEPEGYIDRISSALEGKHFILLAGDPLHLVRCAFDWHYQGDNKSEQLQPWWDNYMIMVYCRTCQALKFEFNEGNYMYCPVCGKHVEGDTITAAAAYSRKHRFRFNSRFFN